MLRPQIFFHVEDLAALVAELLALLEHLHRRAIEATFSPSNELPA